MVAQVLADAGQIVDDWDPQGAQIVRRPHARVEQQVGRSNRTGADDDLVGVDLGELPALLSDNPDRALAGKAYTMYQRITLNGEIRPRPRRFKIA